MDDITAKSLYFGLSLMKNLNDETLLKIDQIDNNNLTKLQEIFRILDEKSVIDYKFTIYLSPFNQSFNSFLFVEHSGKKSIAISSEEMQIIRKTESFINEMGKISNDYFTEDCAL